MQIEFRKYDKYIQVDIEINNVYVDLGFHSIKEANLLLSQLEKAVSELQDYIGIVNPLGKENPLGITNPEATK